MRVSKSSSVGSTSYRYDGQMGMEDIDYSANGVVTKVTDYGAGARGIDGIYVTQNGATSSSYPLYDAHGNMISTLNRAGSGYQTSNLRSFDAWGNIRVGNQTGDPKGRYCASLGHKQDDESGLIYMRARFFEATSGRFVNEDCRMEGQNWFAYCRDNPVNFTDETGNGPDEKFWKKVDVGHLILECLIALAVCIHDRLARPVVLAGIFFMLAWFGMDVSISNGTGSKGSAPENFWCGFAMTTMGCMVGATLAIDGMSDASIAGHAISLGIAYADTLSLFMTLSPMVDG